MPFPWIALALGAAPFIDAVLSNKKYPPEVEAFLKQLSEVGTGLLKEPGFSAEEIASVFGKGFENVRKTGKNTEQQLAEVLSRAGMSGTGTSVKASQEGAWSNENMVVQAIRDMVIAGKEAKQRDQGLAIEMARTAVGGEAARIEKGPQITDLVATLGLLGIGTGESKSPFAATGTTAALADATGGGSYYMGNMGSLFQTALNPYLLTLLEQQGAGKYSTNFTLGRGGISPLRSW